MKNITPRRSSAPRAVARFLLVFAGFLFAAWETRAFWRELAAAVRGLAGRRG